MKWMFALGLVAVAALGLWLVPQNRNDREKWDGGGVVAGSTSSTPHHDVPAASGTAGTSGTHDGAAEVEGGEVVTEIETITGANDGMTLVGRRVDLHVDVQDRANDRAFWVGSRDNRVLVVLGRDNRTGAQRQKGAPASHGIAPVHTGQRATISGVIRAVPKAEHRYSWDLTREDERDLSERKIYIHADTVRSEGHGSF
jgi:hypothetical protein